MITRDSVRKVLEAARIEDVVGDYVTLKKRGSSLLGVCPFHHEKTPSFNVSPAKNIFKCFGCGKAGDSVSFLMEHTQVNFADAIRQLARRYNIDIVEKELTQEVIQEKQLSDSLYIINEYAKTYYEHQLWDTDLGKSIGLSYFKERGFLESTVKKFGLGFAPSNSGSLVEAARLQGYEMDLLRKLGLMTERGRDFFYNRVMFPIHNTSGKVAAMAGRLLVKDDKSPKYINSPESEIYSKSRLLYGVFQARQSIVKLDECLLVEGYTDVISLHQSGIENVVASSGTALTVEQLRLIKRFTPNLTIVYDGDAAGIKAAVRGLEMALAEDMNVQIVLLPAPEDPDSYIQKVGAEAFRAYLKESKKDIVKFKAELGLIDAGNDPMKRSLLMREMVETLALLLDPIKRATYIRELSSIMRMDEATLVGETNKTLQRNLAKQKEKRERERARDDDEAVPGAAVQEIQEGEGTPITAKPDRPSFVGQHEFQERDVVRVLVQFGGHSVTGHEPDTVAVMVLKQIADVIDTFENPTYSAIVKAALTQVQANGELTPAFFLNHEDRDMAMTAIELMTSPWEYSPTWERKGVVLQMQLPPEKNGKADAMQSVLRFKLRKVEYMIRTNLGDIKTAQENQVAEEEIIRLMRVRQKLNMMRNQIAKDLGSVVL